MQNTATATEVKNAIAITDTSHEGWRHITIDCPNGWDDVKKLTKKVLSYDGLLWTWIGWNSDRNVCFFRPQQNVATFVK